METTAISERTVGDLTFERWATEHADAIVTPAYVYDMQTLRTQVSTFQTCFEEIGAKLFFASMANDRPEVLKVLAEMGVGACVNSLAHLSLVRGCGIPASRIQFTSTGLSAATFDVLRRDDITVNLDSFDQLVAWARIGGRSAGVRINAASLAQDRPFDRMGITLAELDAFLAEAERLGVEINGLHVYVGTNVLNVEDILPTIAAFFMGAERVQRLSYLNIGGGIGVDYQRTGQTFDFLRYRDELGYYAGQLRSRVGRPVEIIVEPGRGLVASCGHFLVRVTADKKLSGTRYVGVDGSIANFPRPFHHPESTHSIRMLTRSEKGEASECLICGSTTFSRDILGTALLPADLRCNDILAFEDAGAYSQSMMSRFLGQPDPTTIVLDAKSADFQDRVMQR